VSGAVIALEAEVVAATPGVYQGSLNAVLRFDGTGLKNIPFFFPPVLGPF
jgi:hypothetical protein